MQVLAPHDQLLERRQRRGRHWLRSRRSCRQLLRRGGPLSSQRHGSQRHSSQRRGSSRRLSSSRGQHGSCGRRGSCWQLASRRQLSSSGRRALLPSARRGSRRRLSSDLQTKANSDPSNHLACLYPLRRWCGTRAGLRTNSFTSVTLDKLLASSCQRQLPTSSRGSGSLAPRKAV